MLLSRSPSGPKKYFPIPVEQLEEEVRLRSADDGKRFREEFNVSLGYRGGGEVQWYCPVQVAPRLRPLASRVTCPQQWLPWGWLPVRCPWDWLPVRCPRLRQDGVFAVRKVPAG